MLKKLKTKTINFIPYLLIILTGMNIFNKGSLVLFIFCLYCILVFFVLFYGSFHKYCVLSGIGIIIFTYSRFLESKGKIQSPCSLVGLPYLQHHSGCPHCKYAFGHFINEHFRNSSSAILILYRNIKNF